MDPDGNTFEVTWVIPRAEWGEGATVAPVKNPINLHDGVARRQDQRSLVASTRRCA